MPWRVKRMLVLILCSFVVVICAAVVLFRDRSVDTDLLAVIGLAGGVAILIVALPTNGHEDEA
jgi:hypothetical protein